MSSVNKKKPTKKETEKELQNSIKFANQWRENAWRERAIKLDEEFKQAKIMYLDSLAVIKYLEEKVDRLSKEKE